MLLQKGLGLAGDFLAKAPAVENGAGCDASLAMVRFTTATLLLSGRLALDDVVKPPIWRSIAQEVSQLHCMAS